MMKKLLALVLALTMGLTLAACGGKSDSDVKYVKDKGTLVVGMTDFAPMDYRDGNGEWIGLAKVREPMASALMYWPARSAESTTTWAFLQ